MAKQPPSTWSQFFPPSPVFTDKEIPDDLQGRVYFISGANSGMGTELARVLYSKGAKVYMACRSEEKGKKAIENIQAKVPESKGHLIFLLLDQSDLSKTKVAAERFLAREPRLDVLFNNAGVMTGDSKALKKTPQGHELALGVNCVGAFLLTQLLMPALRATAKEASSGSVRIAWISSYGLVSSAPEEKGIDMNNLDYHISKSGIDRYAISKAGDWLLAVEFSRRYKEDGVLSVPVNPGNVKTELARHQGCMLKLFAGAVCYPVIFGVYTQLFAAFSPEISKADWNSEWVIPWGRLAPLRPDLPTATRSPEEGGNGNAREFWEWNHEQVKQYL